MTYRIADHLDENYKGLPPARKVYLEAMNDHDIALEHIALICTDIEAFEAKADALDPETKLQIGLLIRHLFSEDVMVKN